MHGTQLTCNAAYRDDARYRYGFSVTAQSLAMVHHLFRTEDEMLQAMQALPFAYEVHRQLDGESRPVRLFFDLDGKAPEPMPDNDVVLSEVAAALNDTFAALRLDIRVQPGDVALSQCHRVKPGSDHMSLSYHVVLREPACENFETFDAFMRYLRCYIICDAAKFPIMHAFADASLMASKHSDTGLLRYFCLRAVGKGKYARDPQPIVAVTYQGDVRPHLIGHTVGRFIRFEDMPVADFPRIEGARPPVAVQGDPLWVEALAELRRLYPTLEGWVPTIIKSGEKEQTIVPRQDLCCNNESHRSQRMSAVCRKLVGRPRPGQEVGKVVELRCFSAGCNNVVKVLATTAEVDPGPEVDNLLSLARLLFAEEEIQKLKPVFPCIDGDRQGFLWGINGEFYVDLPGKLYKQLVLINKVGIYCINAKGARAKAFPQVYARCGAKIEEVYNKLRGDYSFFDWAVEPPAALNLAEAHYKGKGYEIMEINRVACVVGGATVLIKNPTTLMDARRYARMPRYTSHGIPHWPGLSADYVKSIIGSQLLNRVSDTIYAPTLHPPPAIRAAQPYFNIFGRYNIMPLEVPDNAPSEEVQAAFDFCLRYQHEVLLNNDRPTIEFWERANCYLMRLPYFDENYRPARPPWICYHIGKAGIGKSLMHLLYQEILGDNFVYIKSFAELFDTFNDHLQRCVLRFVDEDDIQHKISHANSTRANNIKTLGTMPVQVVNKKYVPQTVEQVHGLTYVASNTCPIRERQADDRRMVLMTTAETYDPLRRDRFCGLILKHKHDLAAMFARHWYRACPPGEMFNQPIHVTRLMESITRRRSDKGEVYEFWCHFIHRLVGSDEDNLMTDNFPCLSPEKWYGLFKSWAHTYEIFYGGVQLQSFITRSTTEFGEKIFLVMESTGPKMTVMRDALRKELPIPEVYTAAIRASKRFRADQNVRSSADSVHSAHSLYEAE